VEPSKVERAREREIELPTRRATIALARAIAAWLQPGDVVLLDGGLGAGKTFLARALLRGLGLAEAIAVPSPTFTLMNEYPRDLGVRLPIVHADLYRVRGDHELREGECAPGLLDAIAELGLRERRGEGWALLVEWAGDAADAFGGETLRVRLSRAEHGAHGEHGERAPRGRRAVLVASGPRGAGFLYTLGAIAARAD
jgi:tRNA threonylcarbamoyladenosine biosynthesis protein TsaE